MTARARARRSAPRLTPVLTLVATAPVLTSMSARRFDLTHELIATPCGRIVERRTELPDTRENSYRLWEPVMDGAEYGTTQEVQGKIWGLAHTLHARQGMTFAQKLDWALHRRSRAMALCVVTCRELQGHGALAPRRNCGVVSKFGDTAEMAAQVERAAREARAAQ